VARNKPIEGCASRLIACAISVLAARQTNKPADQILDEAAILCA
jgi:hypothetical protein